MCWSYLFFEVTVIKLDYSIVHRKLDIASSSFIFVGITIYSEYVYHYIRVYGIDMESYPCVVLIKFDLIFYVYTIVTC